MQIHLVGANSVEAETSPPPCGLPAETCSTAVPLQPILEPNNRLVKSCRIQGKDTYTGTVLT